MATYRLTELCQVANVNAQTLRNWITAGLITPAEPGTTGTGNQHRFSAMQVLAVTTAVRHRAEESPPARAVAVMVYVAGLDEAAMQAAFAEGRTFPVPLQERARVEQSKYVAPCILIDLDSPEYELSARKRNEMKRLDLKTLWDEVRRNLAQFDTEAEGKPKAKTATAKAK
jgi:hypothetical protein